MTVARTAPNTKAFFAGAKDSSADAESDLPAFKLSPSEIEKLIAHRLKRERKVVAGLESLGAVSLDELVLTVYDDVAKQLIPWAKRTLLAHLLKLQRDERIQCNNELWELR